MNTAYILLGSNEGDSLMHLLRAIEALELRTGKILKKSSVFCTAPWGVEQQAMYYNQLVVVKTEKNAFAVLHDCEEIESYLGRKGDEKGKYLPRCIDLDIIYINREIIHKENLWIPHKLRLQRRFVLEPMNEIAAEFIDPEYGESIESLLRICTDDTFVSKLDASN